MATDLAAETARTDASDWRPAARTVRMIGRHDALERALRERGIDVLRVESPLRTGELGLMPITASTPLPDLERWLGPGAQALPVLIHADAIAFAHPVSRCGSELALLLAHNSGCAGEPSAELLHAAAARLEAALGRGAPWPSLQLRQLQARIVTCEWSAQTTGASANSGCTQALQHSSDAPIGVTGTAAQSARLHMASIEDQLRRHGLDGEVQNAPALLALLEASFSDRNEHGLSLRPTLCIDGAAGSTRLALRFEDGILINSETWLNSSHMGPGLRLLCEIEHAGRSQRFGLLGRSLAWFEAGEALGRLRDAAATLGLELCEGGLACSGGARAFGSGLSVHPAGFDPVWSFTLKRRRHSQPSVIESWPVQKQLATRRFLRQGPETAGLIPLLENLRPPMLEPGISLLMVHRTRADRLSRQVYRSRTGRWEPLETLESAADTHDGEFSLADSPGNRIYLLSPLPGEQPGESIEGYLRRARDAGEWSQRLRSHLPAHGMVGYRLGRLPADDLSDAMPALRARREHVLTVLAVGIEALEGHIGSSRH
ncbi:MAG: hypothetical protein MEQ07_02890 [Aquimonas sp.]|nr:hypothetical protein [Aquimonas sp.]